MNHLESISDALLELAPEKLDPERGLTHEQVRQRREAGLEAGENPGVNKTKKATVQQRNNQAFSVISSTEANR